MSKWLKRLLGFAAIGTAVAGIAYYLKKSDSVEEEFEDDFEDEDFDLDNDLKPTSEREYVSLNPQAQAEETAPETVEEVTEETVEEAAPVTEKEEN